MNVYILDSRKPKYARDWQPDLYDALSLYNYAKRVKAHMELDGEWNLPRPEEDDDETPFISDEEHLKTFENIASSASKVDLEHIRQSFDWMKEYLFDFVRLSGI